MLKPMSIFSKILILSICFFVLNLSAASKDPLRAKNGIVVSASKLASVVGVEILKKGGNAIDAAAATAFALAVTYPAAGNIGGGGFIVLHLSDGTETTLDFREKAPAAAFRDMFLDANGNYDPEVSQKGMTASGVPGSVAGLIYAVEKYGRLSLEEVISPAIKLAEEGFPLGYRLAQSFNNYKYIFGKYESTSKIFVKDVSFEENELFIQNDLAETLKRIKENGRDGFYKGKTAELLVSQSKKMNGYLSLEDLSNYNVAERKPLKGTYKGYDVVSMPPASSGGVAIIEALNVLENFNFSKDEWNSSEYIHTLTEILKYVYADRAKHLGDSDFYPVPISDLISKNYAQEIYRKIGYGAVPSEKISALQIEDNESTETTHLSVIDKDGNSVSMTTTLNSTFGNKIVVDGAGFIMNNEMDDFSAKPGVPNQFGLLGGEANSIQPGKRMLSSMTPTIVLKEGKPFLIVGSPGGSTIITVVLQVILNSIDFNMDIQQAIDAPRIHHQWMPDQIDYEKFGLAKDVIDNLLLRGHIIGSKRILGRAEGIMVDKYGIRYGATDPRGYGGAAGY